MKYTEEERTAVVKLIYKGKEYTSTRSCSDTFAVSRGLKPCLEFICKDGIDFIFREIDKKEEL